MLMKNSHKRSKLRLLSYEIKNGVVRRTHLREIIYTIIRAKVLIMRRKNRDAP